MCSGELLNGFFGMVVVVLCSKGLELLTEKQLLEVVEAWKALVLETTAVAATAN